MPNQYTYKPDYRRKLPHFQPAGAVLFVTSRLAGSIPVSVLRQMKEEAELREKQILLRTNPAEQAKALYEERKRQFGRWDEILDRAPNGPYWLGEPEIAAIVAEALHYRDGRVYVLDAYCIMPNHLHFVFAPQQKEDGSYQPLQTIMHSLKRNTAAKGNKVLGREDAFWQHESYDHVIRDQAEWERIIRYVLDNPVKAGLVNSWEEWPWTYLRQ
jgi:REP element-mobilizing transposase RayT